MAFELNGTIKEIFDEQTFASGFNKREFVVTVEDDRFPQDIKFECLKDKISQLEGLKKGQEVKVSFDIRGREWKGSYFVNLAAWKVEASSGGAAGGGDEPPLDHYDQSAAADIDDEDVPF